MATLERIIDRYPVLYHVAECGSWPGIKRHGLLSTTALLDRFEKSGPERQAIESEWRRKSLPIEHPVHGVAVIRGQQPMSENALAPLLLDGLTPSQWYKLLNGKCFLWATRERLRTFLNAKPQRNHAHDVLTVDTKSLLDRHSERITLTSFNTGSVGRGRKRRGRDSFQTIQNYCPLNSRNEVAEVVIDYGVPDIAQFTLSVERWRGDEQFRGPCGMR